MSEYEKQLKLLKNKRAGHKSRISVLRKLPEESSDQKRVKIKEIKSQIDKITEYDDQILRFIDFL